ncbi:MAG: hypothetical protein ACK50J_17715, partial [Planctomyces sp.]
LTLYTTPVIYLWFDRIAGRFMKRDGSSIGAEDRSASDRAQADKLSLLGHQSAFGATETAGELP